MQIVPSNFESTNGYQLMETPDDIIINNQIYDKFTMEPKEFKFFNTNFHLNHKVMLKHQVNILEYPWSMIPKEPDYEYYIIDNQDANIFYCISEKAYDNQEQYILKVQKTPEGEYKILNYISPDAGDDYIFMPTSEAGNNAGYGESKIVGLKSIYKILGQNTDFLYIAQIRIHNDVTNKLVDNGTYWNDYATWNNSQELYNRTGNAFETVNYIIIFKQNMSVAKNIKSDNRNNITTFAVFKIIEKNNKLYIMENYIIGSLEWIRIKCFNNQDCKTIKIYDNDEMYIVTDSYTRPTLPPGIVNIFNFMNYYCFYKVVRPWGTTVYTMICKIKIDFDNDEITEILDDTHENFYKSWLEGGPVITGINDKDTHSLQNTFKNINDEYFSITIHDCANKNHQYMKTIGSENKGYWNGNSHRRLYVGITKGAKNYDVYSSKGYHRHYLCKKNSNNEYFKLVKTLTPVSETQHIYGVLYYNELCPIFLMKDGVYGYKLDLETEDYEIILNKPGTYYTIGLDENNSLYLCDINDNIEIYNDNTVYELKVTFEQDTYEYDNQNISTYVTIYAKNFTKDYIKTKVKLTLDGYCHFNATNNNQLITYTNKNGIVNVPITITYGGSVHCDIQEVE